MQVPRGGDLGAPAALLASEARVPSSCVVSGLQTEATSSSKGGPSREADSWKHTASLHKSQQGSNVLFRQAQRHVLVIPAPRKITNSS